MCQTCSRRLFIGGAVTSLVMGRIPGAAAAGTLRGCSFSQTDQEPDELKASSGDAALDEALIIELARILTIIPKINPGFQYLVDKDPNAYATTKTYVSGTNGTVLLGINLIRLLMQQPEGGAAVAGMCAHECGHIYQYNTEFRQRLNDVLLIELHADFLSGIYMGKRAQVTADRVWQLSKALHEHGDYAYTDPNSHGTPGQRAAAMEKGYRLASSNTSFDELAIVGESYVRNLA
jgi:hypothetical protein